MANPKLPSRSNFRTRTRRGGSKTFDATDVPQVRTSSDPGQSAPPKGVFGEYETETLASMGEGLMNLGTQINTVSTKLKQREDDRFLLQAEEEIGTRLTTLKDESIEALDLSDSDNIKGLNGKVENYLKEYDGKASKLNLSPNSLYKYESLKHKLKNTFAVNIAKEKTAINHQRDQGRVYSLSDDIGLDPDKDVDHIADNFSEFDQGFDSQYASLFDEKIEPELKRQGKQRIFTRKIDRLLNEETEKNLLKVKRYLHDPDVWDLQYKPDGTFDKDFSQTLNSYKERVKGIENGRSDVQKRLLAVPQLQKQGILPTEKDSPIVRAFVIENKLPDKEERTEIDKLDDYNKAIGKLPKGEDGQPNPQQKAIVDEIFGVTIEPSDFELKRIYFEQWKKEHPKAEVEEIKQMEASIRDLPMSPELKAKLKVKGAKVISEAAKGADDTMVQALGLTPKPDKLEAVKQLQAQFAFYEEKFGTTIPDEDKKRAFMEQIGLTEKKLSPVEQLYKDVSDLKTRGIPVDDTEVQLLAKQKVGLPLSEAQRKQAIEIETRLNSYKKVQEAKGVVEGVEAIEDEDVKEKVERLLKINVPQDKLNSVELLANKIKSAKKLGVEFTSDQEAILYKQAVGTIPLTKEEKEEAAKLKGRLSAIEEKSKSDTEKELGILSDAGLEGKDSKKMNELIVQTLGGEVNLDTGTTSLPAEKRDLALNMLVRAEQLLKNKKANSLGQAVSMARKEIKIPQAVTAISIADKIIKDADAEPPPSSSQLENAEKDLDKIIKLEDATGWKSAAINIWNSTIGQISEGLISKDVVKARQKLALLEGDFIAAFKRSSRLPVWEQKRLASIFSGPATWTAAGEVREAMKEMDKMLTEEITFQRSLLIDKKMPFDKRVETLRSISALARFRKRVKEFEINPISKYQNVKSIKNASQKEITNLVNSITETDLLNWGNEHPEALKLLRKRVVPRAPSENKTNIKKKEVPIKTSKNLTLKVVPDEMSIEEIDAELNTLSNRMFEEELFGTPEGKKIEERELVLMEMKKKKSKTVRSVQK